MKLAAVQDVVSTNIESSHKFTIEASAKAFKILSGGIYSNTKRAIVRELSCNAYDAHVDAGNPDEPFEVTLPTEITPYFNIRDFGTGLSDDDVQHLYTTYFSSTKTGSNDFIGALGLGSKSPFSYADSFTVISYFNGVSRTYMAYIDNGNPSISKVSEMPTDERNGIEIKVPVLHGDYQSFCDEAEFVYKTFKVKPKFIGKDVNCDLAFDEQIGDVANVVKSYYRADFFAIQGNVLYNISSEHIPNALRGILSGKVYIDFEIGDLAVATSREELAYDEGDTLSNIKDKLNKVLDIVLKDYNTEFSSSKTMYDAVRVLREFSSKWDLSQHTLDTSLDTVWRGTELSQYVNGTKRIKLKNQNVYNAKDNYLNKTLILKQMGRFSFSFYIELVFLVDDKKNFRRRIREYCIKNSMPIRNILVIQNSNSSKKAWHRLLKGCPVKCTSELPDLINNYARSSSSTSDAKVYDSSMNETDNNLEDVTYYAEINRWEIVNKGGNCLYNKYDIAAFEEVSGHDVFLIKSKNIKRLPKDAINVVDILDSLKLSDRDLIEIAMSNIADDFEPLLEASNLRSFKYCHEKWETSSNGCSRISNIKRVNSRFGYNDYIARIRMDLYKRFPLLEMYNSLSSYDSCKLKHKDLMIHYINTGEIS